MQNLEICRIQICCGGMHGNVTFNVHTVHVLVNTFRAAWFRRFLQNKQQFSVALPTP